MSDVIVRTGSDRPSNRAAGRPASRPATAAGGDVAYRAASIRPPATGPARPPRTRVKTARVLSRDQTHASGATTSMSSLSRSRTPTQRTVSGRWRSSARWRRAAPPRSRTVSGTRGAPPPVSRRPTKVRGLSACDSIARSRPSLRSSGSKKTSVDVARRGRQIPPMKIVPDDIADCTGGDQPIWSIDQSGRPPWPSGRRA
jgi:hypothetical protein